MKTRNLTTHILIILLTISASMSAIPSLNAAAPAKKSYGSGGDTSAVLMYTRRALSLGKNAPIEKMKEYIDSAEYICNNEDLEIPALLHLARAHYFAYTNDFNNATQEADDALKFSKKDGDTKVTLKTLLFRGQYNWKIGFFKASIDNYNEAIKVAKENKLKGYIPLSYLGIADIYRTILRDTTEYRNVLSTAIAESARENDSLHLAAACYKLGSSYVIQVRDFKKADSLLRKSLDISVKKKDMELITSSLANMGYNYYVEKRYKEAIECYNKSLTYYVSANALGNLGTIYRDIGNTAKSLDYFKKSLAIAREQNDNYTLYWVYKDLSHLYLKNRDTSNAYINYVQYKKYYDAYTEKANIQGISEEKIRYDAETHNKELQLLSLKLKNQRLIIFGNAGVFVLILAIGILFVSRSRINAKHKISDMNRKISEMTQANLRQQMNPHFIFNTLNSIQYYMYQHDKLATNNYLTKFSSLMRKVLENSQHTSIPLRDELDALKLYLELEMIRFKDRFDYEINVDEEIDPLMYKVPAMLIQPYVENSISHGLMPSDSKGLIKISLKLENSHISCIIEDNGIGREAALVKKRNGHNSLGTQIVASRMDLVNTLYGTSLKTIYTDLKNSTGEAEGTRVEIQIPIIT